MTNKDLISISMDKNLQEILDSGKERLGYKSRSDLVRQALIEFLKKKITGETPEKQPVLLPSELIDILDKASVAKGTTLDEFVARALRGYLEKYYSEFVPIKYPTADRFEDLEEMEKIDLWLLSKQTGVSVEKCFDEMKRKRTLFNECKRAQELTT